MDFRKTPAWRTAATLGLLLPSLACVGWLYAFQAAAPSWPPPVQKVSPDSPALPVEEAMKTFFLPPGYGLELVAAEPLVRDPIVMDQDPDGRLYVIEMPAFAIDETMQDSREPICQVVILEDTDGDGRMDKRTVFADKLVLPRAVKVLVDGVLIGEPPHLWLAKDTDGDGKADSRVSLSDDFGRAEGNIEHNANGLYWGMDNTIYSSEHTWNLRLKNGKFEIEPTPSRGQWNISQDDAGRIYRNWNEQPLYVDIIPGRYFRRNPNIVRTRGLYEILIERNETAIWPVRPTPGLQRAYRKGFLRPDGTATTYASSADPYIFRGDRLPSEVQGNAFVADSPTNLVHRLIIDDDGTGRLKARDAYAKGEFLASTDERFRPVNLFSAADGTLYVIDMYRGVVQDIAYQTEYLNTYIKENKLQLPVGLGRIYRVVHESMRPGPKPSLSRATPAELVKTLSHPNGWWRDMAQQLLVQRHETSVASQLKQLALAAPDWRTKLHALWTLDGIDAIDPATIEKALEDPSPEVRAAAVRISERWLRVQAHSLQAAVLKRISDPNWIVRYQLAASLGELPQAARLGPLTQILQRYGEDPVIVDAAVSGLAGQEMIVMDRLLQGTVPEEKAADAIAMFAAAIANGKNEPAAEFTFAVAADANRPEWMRTALLRGIETGLGGGDRGGGGFGGLGGLGGLGGFGRSNEFTLSSEPQSLTRLANGSGALAGLATHILPRLNWPGKPAAADDGPVLTAEQKTQVAAGAGIYANFCAGCHMEGGEGNPQGGAKSLVGSPLVTGNPAAVLRVVLSGKDGANGLMPPLRSSLNDEQVASVVSYIRRAWGHTASPVTTADVQETRGITSLRKTPWTDEELAPFTRNRFRSAPPPRRP
jgi:mono/diheme cytochrome c family protein/glucose/arabinose dehydrogenase